MQGKPAYLYGEAISFLSYCNDVSVDDIVSSINSFHDVNVKTSEVRNDMIEIKMELSYAQRVEMRVSMLFKHIFTAVL